MITPDHFFAPLPHKRVRASTYARDGSNYDSVRLTPGRTWAARLEGAGKICHLWAAIEASDPGFLLTNLQLLVWFDDQSTPAINVPFGDFVGLGHGVVHDVRNAVFDACSLKSEADDSSGSGSFNFWLPMPFRQNARLEFRLLAGPPIDLAVYIDALMYESGDPGPYHLHAQFSEETPLAQNDPGGDSLNTTGDDNFRLLDIESGEGTYVGCVMSVASDEKTVGKWTEGDDMIFVDSYSWPPTLHGTGTENYFNMDNAEASIQAPYHGVSHFDPAEGDDSDAGRFSMYRWHLLDPIPFRESIRVSFEHGHANNCNASYRGVAFWYGKREDTQRRPVAHDEKALFGNSGRMR